MSSCSCLMLGIQQYYHYLTDTIFGQCGRTYWRPSPPYVLWSPPPFPLAFLGHHSCDYISPLLSSVSSFLNHLYQPTKIPLHLHLEGKTSLPHSFSRASCSIVLLYFRAKFLEKNWIVSMAHLLMFFLGSSIMVSLVHWHYSYESPVRSVLPHPCIFISNVCVA